MKKFSKILAVALSSVFAVTTVALSACSGDTESDEYAVTLNYNDGTALPRTIYVDKEDGAAVSKPDDPVREGYEFTGWTDSEKGGNEISFPYTPKADTTFYAQWKVETFDVTFYYNFDNAPDPYVEKDVEFNSEIQDPFSKMGFEESEKGYLHSGNGDNFTKGEWKTKAGDDGIFVDFPYKVNRDTELYLHWYDSDVDFYKVSFDSNYPNATESNILNTREVQGGKRLNETMAPKPSYEYYTRLGWATTKDATEPDVKWPYEPTSDITLYAVWKRNEYKVYFKYNYTGPDNENYLILDKQPNGDPLYGGTELASAPADPVRNHSDKGFNGEFKFLGWYTGEVTGEKVEFPYTVTGETSLYAHWEMPEVQTNIFDAEFVYIDPTIVRQGFSGEAKGVGIIASGSGSTSEAYPLLGGANPDGSTHTGHFVSYMFDTGAELVFNIYSSEATTATLKACLANEAGQSVTFDDNGKSAFQFIVNGTSVKYSVTLGPSSDFQEITIGNVQLTAGLNVIRLVSANTNNVIGGTTTAIGPRIDYIKLDGTSATLKWRPEYDNFYRNA